MDKRPPVPPEPGCSLMIVSQRVWQPSLLLQPLQHWSCGSHLVALQYVLAGKSLVNQCPVKAVCEGRHYSKKEGALLFPPGCATGLSCVVPYSCFTLLNHYGPRNAQISRGILASRAVWQAGWWCPARTLNPSSCSTLAVGAATSFGQEVVVRHMNGVVVSGCLWVIRWPHFRHLSRVRIICGALYSGTRACYTWGKVSHGQRVVAPVLRAWCACHPLCHSRTATTAFIYLFCVFCSRLAVHKCERFTNFLDQFFLQAIEFSNTGCNCKSVAL